MREGRFLQIAVCVGLVLVCATSARAEDSTREAWDAWTSGDVEQALELSEKALLAETAGAHAWAVRAYLLSKTGRKDEAVEAYERAVEIEPTSAIAWNNLGSVRLDLGRASEARDAFARALEIEPAYADARNNLGAALERLGRATEAQREYQAAAEADPEHATAHNNLGALALRQGRREDARRALRRANELDASLGAPALNLLLMGGEDLQPGAAFDALQAAAARPDAPHSVRSRAYAALAGRAAQAKDFDDSRRLYLEALKLTPRDATLLNNVAVVEDRLGLDREAMLHLEAAMMLRPGSMVSRNNIGIVHVHRGAWDLAESVFRDILEEDPDFHRAHYNLGVVLGARGRLQGAVTSFTRAAQLAPRDADVRYNLGLMRRRLGGSAAGERRAYEAALELDPDLTEAHLSLGCFLADPQTPRDLRDETGARRHLARFLELSSDTDVAGRAQAQAWLAYLDE